MLSRINGTVFVVRRSNWARALQCKLSRIESKQSEIFFLESCQGKKILLGKSLGP